MCHLNNDYSYYYYYYYLLSDVFFFLLYYLLIILIYTLLETENSFFFFSFSFLSFPFKIAESLKQKSVNVSTCMGGWVAGWRRQRRLLLLYMTLLRISDNRIVHYFYYFFCFPFLSGCAVIFILIVNASSSLRLSFN